MKGFIIKYKLYHIPFWLAYHLTWLTMNIGGFREVTDYFLYSDASIKFYFYLVFQTLGVYFNLYYLIPKFLIVGRYYAYVSAVITTILFCTLCITLGYYVADLFSEKSFIELFGVETDQWRKIFFIWVLPTSVAVMTLGMSVKLGKNWLEAEKRKRKLEKENLETELKYLKSQINPHFLFNTINSIFALIPKNPDLASESLANFSEMLRYQLYECNDEKIPLDKELQFIENFIDLEKLRLDEQHTQLVFNINDNTVKKQFIAPFILIPFLENAFKHVSKGKEQPNFIRMDLEVDDKKLNLHIENSFSKNQKNSLNTDQGGIGLKNVKRRLNLIYGAGHRLQYDAKDTKFSVILNITW